MRNYGVFLCIHPSVKIKRVTIHKLPCSSYKQQRRTYKAVYTFRKDCDTFNEAVQRATKWSLEWHAPIKICSRCRRNWNLP